MMTRMKAAQFYWPLRGRWQRYDGREWHTRWTTRSSSSRAILDSGELPAYKIGRLIRIRRADVDEYLERVKVRPGELAHLYPPGEYGDPARER
jgi:hypothetical protein